MNITIFGATGSIGSRVVKQALGEGHDVTAFTRDSARVTLEHDRLQTVEGDVTDPGACLPVVKDADAVIVTLGAGRKGEVREAGTRAVVEAMQQSGGGRLVCQSTLGVGSSRPNLSLLWKYVLFGGLLRARSTPIMCAKRGWSRRATWTGRSCGHPHSPTRAQDRSDTASTELKQGCG